MCTKNIKHSGFQTLCKFDLKISYIHQSSADCYKLGVKIQVKVSSIQLDAIAWFSYLKIRTMLFQTCSNFLGTPCMFPYVASLD